jgi:hypothetical protein
MSNGIGTPYNPKQFQFRAPVAPTGGNALVEMLTTIAQGVTSGLDRKEAKEAAAFEKALAEAKEARAQEDHELSREERRSALEDKIKGEEDERIEGIRGDVEKEVGDSLSGVFKEKRKAEIAGAIHREYPDMSPDEVQGYAEEFASAGMTPPEAVDKMIDRSADRALASQRLQPKTGGASGGVSGARLERDTATDEAILAADQAIAYLKEQYRNDPASALPPDKWADQVTAFVNQKFPGINQSTFQVRVKGLLDRARTELNLGEEFVEATPTPMVQ